MEENDLRFLRTSGLAIRDGQSLNVQGSKENVCSVHGRVECKYTAKTLPHVRTTRGHSRGLVAQARTSGHPMDSKGLS
jgi:hypothetical protein